MHTSALKSPTAGMRGNCSHSGFPRDLQRLSQSYVRDWHLIFILSHLVLAFLPLIPSNTEPSSCSGLFCSCVAVEGQGLNKQHKGCRVVLWTSGCMHALVTWKKTLAYPDESGRKCYPSPNPGSRMCLLKVLGDWVSTKSSCPVSSREG